LTVQPQNQSNAAVVILSVSLRVNIKINSINEELETYFSRKADHTLNGINQGGDFADPWSFGTTELCGKCLPGLCL